MSLRSALKIAAPLAASLIFLTLLASARAAKPLQIYFIDVEGGQATLVATPSGQSLLIDTGWPGFNGRDADRIVAAAHAAHISRIDYVLITHYHDDHVGGVPQLVKRIKVGTFVDHGPNQEDSDATRQNYAAYQKASAGHPHILAAPGIGLPLKGLSVEMVTAAGERIQGPLPGAGNANPNCGQDPLPAADPTENARSIGLILQFGNFRFVDLGDLTKQKELELVCPNNLIGSANLLLVSHHGMDYSNTKALVWTLHPRVAVFDNGPHKGASVEAWQVVHDSPGIEDVWQLHYAVDGGKDHNVAEDHIANPAENCEGKSISVQAKADGTFTIVNSRNGFTKTYGQP